MLRAAVPCFYIVNACYLLFAIGTCTNWSNNHIVVDDMFELECLKTWLIPDVYNMIIERTNSSQASKELVNSCFRAVKPRQFIDGLANRMKVPPGTNLSKCQLMGKAILSWCQQGFKSNHDDEPNCASNVIRDIFSCKL